MMFPGAHKKKKKKKKKKKEKKKKKKKQRVELTLPFPYIETPSIRRVPGQHKREDSTLAQKIKSPREEIQ